MTTVEALHDLSGILLTEIFENAPAGHHMLSASLPTGPVSMRFSIRESDRLVYHEAEDIEPASFAASIADSLFFREYAMVSMRSLLFDGMMEIRGWMVGKDDYMSLTADDLIEAYCKDEEGNFRNPPVNVRYCQYWKSN